MSEAVENYLKKTRGIKLVEIKDVNTNVSENDEEIDEEIEISKAVAEAVKDEIDQVQPLLGETSKRGQIDMDTYKKQMKTTGKELAAALKENAVKVKETAAKQAAENKAKEDAENKEKKDAIDRVKQLSNTNGWFGTKEIDPAQLASAINAAQKLHGGSTAEIDEAKEKLKKSLAEKDKEKEEAAKKERDATKIAEADAKIKTVLDNVETIEDGYIVNVNEAALSKAIADVLSLTSNKDTEMTLRGQKVLLEFERQNESNKDQEVDNDQWPKRIYLNTLHPETDNAKLKIIYIAATVLYVFRKYGALSKEIESLALFQFTNDKYNRAYNMYGRKVIASFKQLPVFDDRNSPLTEADLEKATGQVVIVKGPNDLRSPHLRTTNNKALQNPLPVDFQYKFEGSRRHKGENVTYYEFCCFTGSGNRKYNFLVHPDGLSNFHLKNGKILIDEKGIRNPSGLATKFDPLFREFRELICAEARWASAEHYQQFINGNTTAPNMEDLFGYITQYCKVPDIYATLLIRAPFLDNLKQEEGKTELRFDFECSSNRFF